MAFKKRYMAREKYQVKIKKWRVSTKMEYRDFIYPPVLINH